MTKLQYYWAKVENIIVGCVKLLGTFGQDPGFVFKRCACRPGPSTRARAGALLR